MIARKSWRFLRLCIRIKRGLLRPYRIHKEIMSLAEDEWKTHDLNKKKTKNDQLISTVDKQQALIEELPGVVGMTKRKRRFEERADDNIPKDKKKRRR